MKKVLFVALAIAVVAATGALAGGKHCKGSCPCQMEGVTKSVENLENGVRVTLSAKDPKIVATVQEKMGKRDAGESECPMMALKADHRVENTADGVVMTVTSADPEVVKKLQSHMAGEVQGHEHDHGDKKDCPHHKKDAA